MAAARYWRLTRIEPYNYDAGLVLSEIALYEGETRVDALATISATVAPTTGTLADLSDANFGTSVTWGMDAAFNPGFAITYDFGADKDITKVSLAGPARDTFIHKYLVESSTDGVTWLGTSESAVITKWNGAAAFHENLLQASGDDYFSLVSVLLHMDGVDNSTSFVDSSGNALALAPFGDARVEATGAKFGTGSLALDGAGDYLRVASSAVLNMGTGDFTYEAWVYPLSTTGSFRMILTRQELGDSAPAFQLRIADTGNLQVVIRQNGQAAASLTTSGTIPANQWSHVAICRSGTTCYLFINGVLGVSGTMNQNFDPTVAVPLTVGALDINGTVTGYFTGLIDDVRVTKGVARYLANFVVPVAAFPNTGTTSDVYSNSVALLMNCNGTKDSTVFVDSSYRPKSITANGNAKISTAQSKYGGASAVFDGNGDVLTIPSSAEFDLGNTYTIEFWIRPNSVASNFGVLHRGWYNTSNNTWTELAFSIRWLGSACRFYFFATVNTNEKYIDVPNAFAANEWRHCAMVREGTTCRVYINGTLAGTLTGVTDVPGISSSELKIGVWDYSSGNEWLNGYLDDIRITKGVARYNGNFAPPGAELKVIERDATPLRGSRSVGGFAISEYAVPEGGAVFPALPLVVDVEDGGAFKIVGTVKEVALPVNLPLARRVRLYEERSGRLIKSTFSDAAGNYAFTEIRGDRPYTVVAFDYTDTYRAVVADKLIAEPM